MTDELVRRLMAAGLTKQQANSVTAETLVNLFMNDDGNRVRLSNLAASVICIDFSVLPEPE